MNKILKIFCFIALTTAVISCKKEEPVRSDLDTQEIMGHWVMVPDSGEIDTSRLEEYKQLIFWPTAGHK